METVESSILKRLEEKCRKECNDGGVVHCDYLPMLMSNKEYVEEERKNRINKSYARVRLSNPNPHYRHKRGEIVGMKSDNGGKQLYCIKIETVNTCDKNGFHTLLGVIYPNGYSDIWFLEDELENFESYDKNGAKIPYCVKTKTMI